VVFNLVIKTTGEIAGPSSTVRARRFDLQLVPAWQHFLLLTVTVVVLGRLGRRRPLSWVAIRADEIVRQDEQARQQQGPRGAQDYTMGQSHDEPMMVYGHTKVNGNVNDAEQYRMAPLSVQKARCLRLVEVGDVNADDDILSHVPHVGVPNFGEPVECQDEEKVDGLESMPSSGRLPIVQSQEGPTGIGVGIVLCVVGVGMMGPMLLIPQPLRPTNAVSKPAQQLIDIRSIGRDAAVIGVVLHVQPDPGLGDAIRHGQRYRRPTPDPSILTVGIQANVQERPVGITSGGKALSMGHEQRPNQSRIYVIGNKNAMVRSFETAIHRQCVAVSSYSGAWLGIVATTGSFAAARR
jgi:hypothetical protein